MQLLRATLNLCHLRIDVIQISSLVREQWLVFHHGDDLTAH